MKKSLLALAVLGAFTGTAVAQSSVTLFGIVDVNGRYVKNDDQRKRLSLSTDGVNSSRLGFRGIEDLGGGLRAGFWLEASVNPDQGTVNSPQFFNRRSTVSLISGAGELRLGNDYIPTFWNQTIYDAFGSVGLGGGLNVMRYVHVRQGNSIGYFLPSNIGGFYGQAMVSASEEATTSNPSADKPGRYIGARVGFAAGPFDVAVAGSTHRFSAASTPGILAGDRVQRYNVGGSWDFGFVKLMGFVDRAKFENAKEMIYSISGQTTFGQNQVRVGYHRGKFDPDSGTDLTVHKVAATYQYNLSKRTAMYGTIAWLDNKDGSTVGLPGGFGAPGSGDSSKGFELGVRHIF